MGIHEPAEGKTDSTPFRVPCVDDVQPDVESQGDGYDEQVQSQQPLDSGYEAQAQSFSLEGEGQATAGTQSALVPMETLPDGQPVLSEKRVTKAVKWYTKSDVWDARWLPGIARALGVGTDIDEAFVQAVAGFQLYMEQGDLEKVDGKLGGGTRGWIAEYYPQADPDMIPGTRAAGEVEAGGLLDNMAVSEAQRTNAEKGIDFNWMYALQDALELPDAEQTGAINRATIQAIALFQRDHLAGGADDDAAVTGVLDDTTVGALRSSFEEAHPGLQEPMRTQIEIKSGIGSVSDKDGKDRSRSAGNPEKGAKDLAKNEYYHHRAVQEVLGEDWTWARYTNQYSQRKFLGRTIIGHPQFLERVQLAESYLGSLDTYKGMDTNEIGDALGVTQVSHIRYPKKDTQYTGFHFWGFALDINAGKNPYFMSKVGAHQKDKAERAAHNEVYKNVVDAVARGTALMGQGVRLGDRSIEHTAKTRTTREIYQLLNETSEALSAYANIADDRAAIEARLSDPKLPADVRKLGVDFWVEQIPKDVVLLEEHELVLDREVELDNDGDGVADEAQTTYQGFTDMKEELVVSLRDVAGFHWGACDFGGTADGDVMHFDARSIKLAKSLNKAANNFKDAPKNAEKD